MIRSLLLFTLILTFFVAEADTTTLRNYDLSNGTASQTTSFNMECQWFRLPAPAEIQEIRILTDGGTGTLDMRVFGHEAGIPWPEVQDDLIATQTLSKSSAGSQWLTYTPATPIQVPDNQFFIAFENISAGVFLTQDQVVRGPLCTSSLGGNVHLQYFFNGLQWTGGANSFLIEVLIDVPNTAPTNAFTDVTSSVGINTNLGHNRLAAADFDNDGWVDLMINGRIYQNDINNSGMFINSNNPLGVRANSQAHAFIDSDNDGDLDILTLQFNDSTSNLYINDGNANFTEKNLPNLPPFPAINSISFADVNGDNLVDFHVGQIWRNFPFPLQKFFFLNDGNNDFIDNTTLFYNDTIFGASRGSQFTDYNNDGHVDLYVANYVTHADKARSPRDELWMNNGNGTFTNVIGSTVIDNTAGPLFWNFSSGCDWSDYDNDGDMDLLASTLSHPRNMDGILGEFTMPSTIYQNNGAPNYDFTDQQGSHGFHFEESHAGGKFADVNNDGLLDAFFTAFYECRFVDLYIQQPNNTFALESFDWGLDSIDTEQDAIFVDYDNDGDLDLLAGDNQRVKLFRNDIANAGNYVKIKPQSNTTNIMAVGARVHVYSGGQQYLREVVVGQSQKMQQPYMLHFGLGSATTVDSVVIQWPGDVDNRNTYTNIMVNQTYTLTEFVDTTMPIDTMDTMIIGLPPLAVLESLNAFPNPTSNDLFVELPDIDSDMIISVFDMYGREMYQGSATRSMAGTLFNIDVRGLAAGKYLAKLQAVDTKQSAVFTFIKMPK